MIGSCKSRNNRAELRDDDEVEEVDLKDVDERVEDARDDLVKGVAESLAVDNPLEGKLLEEVFLRNEDEVKVEEDTRP